MLLDIIDFIIGVLGILILCVVAIIAFFVLLFWLGCKSNDKMLREKFGENYQTAISTEFTDIECNPYPAVVSKNLIDEKYCPHIKLPDFHVKKCISHMRHFTGDTSETVYIEFLTLPDQAIFYSCRAVSSIYLDEDGIRHAVIKYMSNEDMIEWAIDIQENSHSAKISYMSM